MGIFDNLSHRLLNLIIWSITNKKQNFLYYLKKLTNSFEHHTEAILEIIKKIHCFLKETTVMSKEDILHHTAGI